MVSGAPFQKCKFLFATVLFSCRSLEIMKYVKDINTPLYFSRVWGRKGGGGGVVGGTLVFKLYGNVPL